MHIEPIRRYEPPRVEAASPARAVRRASRGPEDEQEQEQTRDESEAQDEQDADEGPHVDLRA